MTFKKRVVKYEPVDVDLAQLVPLAEAARMLDMSMPGVIRAIERGSLTEIVDDAAGYHGRRLLLRSEVEKMAREKKGEG